MRSLLILFIAFLFVNVKSEYFSAIDIGTIWDGSINPIFLPLKVEPQNSYRSNVMFPGLFNPDTLEKELAAGFANNSFDDLFLNFQNENERTVFGVRIFNLDYNSVVKNKQHEYTLDSSVYEYDNYKYENFSASIDGYLNSKRVYQTGISLKAGILRDSIVSKLGESVVDTSLVDLEYENYYQSLRKIISYNVGGTLLQRLKKCRKKTFIMLNGEMENSVKKYHYYDFNGNYLDSNYVKKNEYSFSIKPGVLRFRDKKRLAGVFVGLDYKKSYTRDDFYPGNELLDMGLYNSDYRKIDFNERFYLEGVYSRKLNLNKVSFFFGHNIEVAYLWRGQNLYGVRDYDSSLVSFNYTTPLLIQFKAKDVLIIHSSYNLSLQVDYLIKHEIGGDEIELDSYEKTPECDFQFSTTPLAFTLNLKERLQFSFVPSFDSDGVFIYKGELRCFFK